MRVQPRPGLVVGADARQIRVDQAARGHPAVGLRRLELEDAAFVDVEERRRRRCRRAALLRAAAGAIENASSRTRAKARRMVAPIVSSLRCGGGTAQTVASGSAAARSPVE